VKKIKFKTVKVRLKTPEGHLWVENWTQEKGEDGEKPGLVSKNSV
jgi:hypothetical protein